MRAVTWWGPPTFTKRIRHHVAYKPQFTGLPTPDVTTLTVTNGGQEDVSPRGRVFLARRPAAGPAAAAAGRGRRQDHGRVHRGDLLPPHARRSRARFAGPGG